MNRIYLFAAVAVALAVASAAHAADPGFCDTLTKVGDEALSRFSKFKGPRDEQGDFTSNLILPGADYCYVSREDRDFVCTWKLSFTKSVQVEGRKLADGIKACFPEAKDYPDGNGDSERHRIVQNGVAFRVHWQAKRNVVFLGVGRS